MKILKTLTLLLATLLATNICAQTITLDPTFGENGMTVIPATGTGQFELFDFDKRGNIIAVGYDLYEGKYYLTIIKTNANGTLDHSFGTDGIVTIPEYNKAGVLALKITKENKIFITGNFYDNKRVFMQFNEDGALDETFGENGKITLELGTGTATINLENDDFVLFGSRDNNSILKCNYYGVIDESFGQNGRAYLTDGETFSIAPNNIKILKDQSILIVGVDTKDPGAWRSSAFCKISFNGNIVTDFANNGAWKRTFHPDPHVGVTFEGFEDVLEDSSENLILLGRMTDDSYIVSFNSTGSINNDFGTDGVYYFSFTSYLIGHILQVENNYLIGLSNRVRSINLNGTLDSSFNHTGIYNCGSFLLQDMKLQEPNKLILGGYFNGKFPLMRLNIPYEVSVKQYHELNKSITVFPNPAKDYLFFKTEKKIEIIDMQGKVLIKSERPVQSVNVSHLKAGVYFIKFEGGRVGKFVKI